MTQSLAKELETATLYECLGGPAGDILGTMKALNHDAGTRAKVGEILQSRKPEITHA